MEGVIKRVEGKYVVMIGDAVFLPVDETDVHQWNLQEGEEVTFSIKEKEGHKIAVIEGLPARKEQIGRGVPVEMG